MRTRSLVLAAGILSVACADEAEQTEPVATGWELVWSDEFDGAAGSGPADHWVPDVGGDGWGNDQLEYNTDRTDNAFLDGSGNLVIRAQPEEYEGNAYTSARLTTKGTVTVGRSRVEARIKVPEGQGIWPAFWLLGADIDDVGWPTCGEIDILETKGDDTQTVITTVHGPGYSGGEGVGTSTVLADTSASDDFHVYAVDIDDGHLVWWVDDRRVHTVRIGDLPGGTAWAFDNDFFIILNVAVGGNFLDPPDDSTPFPADLVVDYVRVYERPGG
jgi:beta-glucanase (GH16 family)